MIFSKRNSFYFKEYFNLKIYITGLLCLLILQSFNSDESQVETKDSLKKIFEKGQKVRKEKPDSALIYFNEAFRNSEKILEKNNLKGEQVKEISDIGCNSLNKAGLIFYFKCHYDSAITYYRKALDFSVTYKNRWQQAESLFYIAEVHLEKGNFPEALKIYNESKEIYKECKDAQSVFHCYNSLGIVAKLQGDYLEALENYNKAYHIADSIDDKISQGYIYNNIGNVFKNRGEFAGAMENYEKAYKIFEQEGEQLLMSDCLNNIGDILKETGSFRRADEYYIKALKIAKGEGDNYRTVGLYKNLAETAVAVLQFDSAHVYFERAIELSSKIGDRVRLADCYKDYGFFYEKQGDFDTANRFYQMALEIAYEFNNQKETADINVYLARNHFKSNQINNAILYAEKGFKKAKEIGALKVEGDALRILSDSYLTLGDTLTGFKYFITFSEVKDSLLRAEQIETIEKIEARHQLAEKDKENLLLQAESENQKQKLKLSKILTFAFALGVILLLVIAVLLIRRIKDARTLFKQNEYINWQKVNELNKELDFKNRELTTKVLNLAQKDELIGKISQRLKEINGMNGNAQKEINGLFWELKSDLQKDNWDEFDHHFLKVHPDFYRILNLRFPNLTTNEKKICAFLKLNLKTKDISAITGQSVKSIEVARSRLRRKMELSKDENLNSFIDKV
ncbi:MAG: tetratricopeptide repeat protein [Prolixibacteraceae bacterium]|nr:tetratricopeptide repeat protein [Prolixibacteraceae bacterium]MBN2772879.1 tetratricopeptide repeat protein [Prolixibacteraceae bacterium]